MLAYLSHAELACLLACCGFVFFVACLSHSVLLVRLSHACVGLLLTCLCRLACLMLVLCWLVCRSCIVLACLLILVLACLSDACVVFAGLSPAFAGWLAFHSCVLLICLSHACVCGVGLLVSC